MTIPGRGWWVGKPKEERLTVALYRERRKIITDWCEQQFGPPGKRWIPPAGQFSEAAWRFQNTDDLFLFNLVWK